MYNENLKTDWNLKKKQLNRLKFQQVCIWMYTLSVAARKCSYISIKQLTFTGIKIFYRCQIYKND